MLLDTSAWVEFLNGTEKGKKVEKILKTIKCFTSIVSLAEIAEICSRHGKDIKEYADKVTHFSTILPLDEKISILAGHINFARKKLVSSWGMLDSFILATTMLNNLRILTADTHFKDLPNVEML